MQSRYFVLIILVYISLITSLAYFVPIAPHEAKIFFTSNDIVSQLMHLGSSYFYGTFGVRILFVLSAILSIWLFYIVANDYIQDSRDSKFATTIFAFLPAVIIGGVVANISILILLFLLLYLVAHHRRWYPLELLSMGAIWWISDGSIVFFIALVFYSLRVREWRTLASSILFIIILFMQQRWIEIGGKPIGHLVETIGLFATIFTPFLFLYYVFVTHSLWVKEPRNIIGYISFVTFLIAMLMSIRQRIVLVDFVPYIIIGIIPMVTRYLSSLRVRLPQFQTNYKRGFRASIALLSIGVAVIISMPIIFSITNKSPYGFANKLYKPYILSQDLKSKRAKCYTIKESKERYQLQYYGIQSCN